MQQDPYFVIEICWSSPKIWQLGVNVCCGQVQSPQSERFQSYSCKETSDPELYHFRYAQGSRKLLAWLIRNHAHVRLYGTKMYDSRAGFTTWRTGSRVRKLQKQKEEIVNKSSQKKNFLKSIWWLNTNYFNSWNR